MPGRPKQVVLEGLDIEGLGTGINGVQINSGLAVYIIRCSIRHFTGNGVNLVSSTASGRVVIQNSFVSFNAGGLNVQGAGGVPNSGVVMDTLMDTNTSFAVQANGANNAIALIRSVLTGSPAGINALGGAAVGSFGPSNIITGTGSPTVSPLFK